MVKFGMFLALAGWVTSMHGYTPGHVACIAIGLSLTAWGVYLARR